MQTNKQTDKQRKKLKIWAPKEAHFLEGQRVFQTAAYRTILSTRSCEAQISP